MADDKERIMGMEKNEGLPSSKSMDHVEYDAFHGVPKSTGFPPVVVYFAVLCLGLIFGVGAWTIVDSKCSHVWPAADSLKISLNNTQASASTKQGFFGSCYDQH